MWDEYQKYFPPRYFQWGYIDDYVDSLFKTTSVTSALDVGGGVEGSLVLKNRSLILDILDPYVEKPSEFRDRVDWETSRTYDFILARGCLNYLKSQEFKKIIQFLNPGGFFIANTFKNPPSKEWSKKHYKTLDGCEGIEEFRLVGKKVQHVLKVRGKVIRHEFYYYPPASWGIFFPGVEVTEHGTNSLLLKYKKKN